MARKVTVVLATTEPRVDGVQFAIEDMISHAESINASNGYDGSGSGRPNKVLPFFLGHPYSVKAWVSHPEPGGPAVLYAEGQLTDAVERSLSANPHQHTFVCAVLPYIA